MPAVGAVRGDAHDRQLGHHGVDVGARTAEAAHAALRQVDEQGGDRGGVECDGAGVGGGGVVCVLDQGIGGFRLFGVVMGPPLATKGRACGPPSCEKMYARGAGILSAENVLFGDGGGYGVADLVVCVGDLVVCVGDHLVCVADLLVCVADLLLYVGGCTTVRRRPPPVRRRPPPVRRRPPPVRRRPPPVRRRPPRVHRGMHICASATSSCASATPSCASKTPRVAFLPQWPTSSTAAAVGARGKRARRRVPGRSFGRPSPSGAPRASTEGRGGG